MCGWPGATPGPLVPCPRSVYYPPPCGRASCTSTCCRGWRRCARPRCGCTWRSRRWWLSAAWRRAWWDAEREEALRVLEDELASSAAWQPAQALWGGGDADELGGGGGGAGPQEAWQAEFWPPVVAERALALVAELARKCGWL